MKIAKPGYKRAALAFMAVLLILLVILDSAIYFWEQEVLVENSYNEAQNELELIGTFVTEPLLRHEFAIVEQFMIQWGELKNDVISLKAITPNGLLLAEYNRPSKSSKSFSKSFSVKFSGQHLLDVEIIKDLKPTIHHLQNFKRRLVFHSLLITIFFGILLWYTLKLLAIRPLEEEIKKRKQAEENIQKAHNRMEELVAERTKQLRETNIELHNEIFEKNKMQEELLKTKKLESVSVLAGGIAHDFNNILAAIIGNINLAMLYTDHEDKRHKLLADAEKASFRARDLTQQLLTFSRGGEPVKTLASIEEVIRDSAGFVLRGSKVRCNYHFGEGLLPVEIDSGQISQVIQNIIINASHAMPDGGVIDVTCENCYETLREVILPQSTPFIKIAIQDRGIGIPPTLIDKIFDPYFSTKHEGSGLGLAICHSIVTKHNGQITAKSEQNVGTIFTIYLPAIEGKQLAGKKGQEDILIRESGKALVMDDEEMVRNIALEMLSYLGFQVILTNDGAETIKVYQKNMADGEPFDIVIMDLTIPGGMGGSEAIQKILQLNPQAKVIVSSGYSNDPVMANYSAHGFSGVITKPFKINELSDVIQKILAD